jgi:hypothetical protein
MAGDPRDRRDAMPEPGPRTDLPDLPDLAGLRCPSRMAARDNAGHIARLNARLIAKRGREGAFEYR